jgi:hypothetical protein
MTLAQRSTQGSAKLSPANGVGLVPDQQLRQQLRLGATFKSEVMITSDRPFSLQSISWFASCKYAIAKIITHTGLNICSKSVRFVANRPRFGCYSQSLTVAYSCAVTDGYLDSNLTRLNWRSRLQMQL